MRIFQTAAAIVALSCTSTASIFPFPQHAQRDALPITAQAAQETNVLVARQASKTSFDLSFSGVQGNTATTRTGSSATESSSGGSSADATGSSQTAKGSGTKAKSSHQVTKTFDPRLPAGGLQMITPAPTAAPSYYKIFNYVTFAWNYTSLSVTPSAVDVLATCTVNSQLYTIALNQSITASTQAITWDTNAYQSSAAVPLLTGEYTLIVHDSSKDISAMASAGYLATFQNFRFGMYVRQPYKDLEDWQCVTCNSAMSNIEKQTLTMVCGMAALCVLSFSWFSSVAGLW